MTAELAKTLLRAELDKGASYREAVDAVGLSEVLNAWMEEPIDGFLGQVVARAGKQRCDESAMEQATELWLAGWTSELPEQYKHNSRDFWRQCAVMSWFWRAPSKRPGKPGRKYLSTNQAYNAMKRATADV